MANWRNKNIYDLDVLAMVKAINETVGKGRVHILTVKGAWLAHLGNTLRRDFFDVLARTLPLYGTHASMELLPSNQYKRHAYYLEVDQAYRLGG